MKLLIAIVNKRDTRRLNDALIEAEYRFTRIGSVGGFLRAGNETLLIGLDDHDVETVLNLIRTICRSREEPVGLSQPDTRIDVNPLEEAITVPVGGAQVFVVNVEQMVQL